SHPPRFFYRATKQVVAFLDTLWYLKTITNVNDCVHSRQCKGSGGTGMANMMRAARMHAVGQPMTIDIVERPVAKATDVVVQVKACGMVPNLGNVLANWPSWCPHLPLPRLPAT